MALTLRYSLQDSIIKPSDVTGKYARLQVYARPELRQITISHDDYQAIVQDLKEGRLIALQDEEGTRLGQFMTSLSGGVVVKDFISPSKSEVRVSFKPTTHFLDDVREGMLFEKQPTVRNDPEISEFIFTDITGNTFSDKIPISTNGLLKVTGSNFVKNGMQVTITQPSSTAKVRLNTQVNSGVRFIDMLISNIDIDVANSFTTGLAILTVKRQDNPQRKDEYEFKIV